VLFALDGGSFVALALAALGGARWWRMPSTLLLVATLLAYLKVIVSGEEPPDDLGMATKLVELLALGLVLAPVSRAKLRWISATAGLVAAILVTGVVAWGAELRADHATNAPAGHSDRSHGGKLVQTAAPPSAEQQAAATRLLTETTTGIARFQELGIALADGYRPGTPPEAPTMHYSNPAYAHGHVLDPAHPQALVYSTTPRGPLLLGAMYMMSDAKQPGPSVGGSLTEWHVHQNLCFAFPGPQLAGIQSPFGSCPVGTLNAPTPAMLHVWIVDNPWGPFGELDPAYEARLAHGDS
jgi:hypothetical protein